MLGEELQAGAEAGRLEAAGPPGKRRTPQSRLQVCVSPEEALRIGDAARAADLSVSAYLRALGLGYRPMAVIDLEEALKLNHLGSNLGRLGGLLKLWISDGPRPDRYSPAEFRALINGLIDQVRANQDAMRRSVRRVLKAHPHIRRVSGPREGDDALDEEAA